MSWETSETERGPGLSAVVGGDGAALYIGMTPLSAPTDRRSVGPADVLLARGVDTDHVAGVDEERDLKR